MADNTGDGFNYKNSPVYYSDTPLGFLPVTLICSVVRIRSSDSPLEPHCRKMKDGRLFYYRKGNELIGNTDRIQLPDQLSSSPNIYSSEEPPPK